MYVTSVTDRHAGHPPAITERPLDLLQNGSKGREKAADRRNAETEKQGARKWWRSDRTPWCSSFSSFSVYLFFCLFLAGVAAARHSVVLRCPYVDGDQFLPARIGCFHECRSEGMERCLAVPRRGIPACDTAKEPACEAVASAMASINCSREVGLIRWATNPAE